MISRVEHSDGGGGGRCDPEEADSGEDEEGTILDCMKERGPM